ncbi:hypothetical protein G4B88_023516 [Cannabis sativa]|uniref:Endonuclease/exonuclease/phosphatase domain-containing protein n=1 Tax=Cannabis sativa TaxID=3483 RepID=A0A7J6HUN3_CANSA|nr:hypothetical protein G4B88_023516 [Cannabis sativa]
MFAVDVCGRSGGVALLWRNKEDVKVLNYATNFVDVEVRPTDVGEWRLTGFYGESKRRGFCLLWNPSAGIKAVKVWPTGFKCLVLDESINAEWNLYAIYGPPYDERMCKFSEDVARYVNDNDKDWAIMGDLNLIHKKEDKSGGRNFAPRDGQIMNEFLFNVGGVDIGFSGCKFTWRNKREV